MERIRRQKLNRLLWSALIALGMPGLWGCATVPSPARPAAVAASAATAPVARAAAPDPRAEELSVPFAVFSGSPDEIGRAHAARFHSQIDELFNHYLLARIPAAQLVMARLAAASFETFMLPEHRQEILALARGMGLSPYDGLLAQCFPDLLPMQSCSTISLPAEASPDGIARMGRNLDFDPPGILAENTVVIAYHPAGRYSFATIGWPGMVGALSGMNQWGLCLANMEVERELRPPSAMPYTLLYRSILENCRTVDEAVAYLDRTPRQSANNLMLMDAAGNRAVAEITPGRVTVRRALPGAALISTNHQRGQDANTPGRCWRYDSLHRVAGHEFGKISRYDVEHMLGQVVQGERGEMTIQSMVFEPASRTIYLATGPDAPTLAFNRLDLKPYFAAAAGGYAQ